jgi:hypothetical protein
MFEAGPTPRGYRLNQWPPLAADDELAAFARRLMTTRASCPPEKQQDESIWIY